MSGNERGWEEAGQIVLVIILLSLAFRIGLAVGSIDSRDEEKANDSLNHALEVIDEVDVEDVDDVCESFDTVMDDIHDALAWMGWNE